VREGTMSLLTQGRDLDGMILEVVYPKGSCMVFLRGIICQFIDKAGNITFFCKDRESKVSNGQREEGGNKWNGKEETTELFLTIPSSSLGVETLDGRLFSRIVTVLDPEVVQVHHLITIYPADSPYLS
jgi:hypothetical protein